MSSVSNLVMNKGPLSAVWIAGTMEDKVGKRTILSTDISTAAQQIIQEDRVNLVLRVSGMLLKGLAVVYSRKTKYMLGDCEEIINKIMQSFKTGSSVNLPDVMRSLPKEIGAVTIEQHADDGGRTQTFDLDEWARAHDPESEFIVQAAPLDFPSSTAENSQINTQVDYSSSTATNTQIISSSDADIHEFHFDNSRNNNIPNDVDLPVPEWVDLPENDDDVDAAPPPPMFDNFDGDDDDDAMSEENQNKKRTRIVDKGTTKGNVPQQRKRARPVASRREQAMPQNEELENLFELARQQFSATNQKNDNQDEDDFDDIPQPMMNDNFSDEPEVLRGNDNAPMSGGDSASEGSDSEDADDANSSVKTPNEDLLRTPQSTLFSPFPNVQFAVETTPRRTVETSITHETLKTLRKIKKSLDDKDEISFNNIFRGSSRRAAASAFLQVLILKSATNEIDISQKKPLGEIEITRGSNSESK